MNKPEYESALKMLEQFRFGIYEGFEHEIKRRAEFFGKNLEDYERVAKEKVKGFNPMGKQYTHFIEEDDSFNESINNLVEKMKPNENYIFAKPLKKDTPTE